MEIKQRGNALGHNIILFIYKVLGYRVVSFILNFVAIYYVLFTPTVKKSLRSYYKHQGIKFTNKAYFSHIKIFSLSIFDRFISRIKTDELSFDRFNVAVIDELQGGGVVLLSHVGSWASATNILANKFPLMNIVMRENTKEDINKVEENIKRENTEFIKIIDLNKGVIAANIQIANALIAKELVALMADRVVDDKQSIEVEFFGSTVRINKNPFDIARRLKKPLATIFVMNGGFKKYNIYLHMIKEDTIEEMAQSYTTLLEETMKKYPNQWYNFYDFFQE